ncbi:hypothetical protein F5Y19DRAFT_120426 [Xylariaceae sp. FL1651]|nr:hypothetical protein F5Y19DRAFT_120426 [Xylariaceae sp. FL1651]
MMVMFGLEKRRRAIEEIKAIKWRQWVLMPALPVTGAALITNTIVIIDGLESFASYSNDNTGPFSFYDVPNGPVRSKVITAITLEVVLLVALWAETIHFAIFFHRDDRVYRRSAIQVSLVAALVVLAAVMKVVGDELVGMPLNVDTAITKRPELTAEQFSAAYKSWLHFVISETGLIVFIVAIINGAVHVIVLIFWLWLLPARHRLPNRYEPVVDSKKRSKTLGSSSHPSYELVNTADPVDTGPLAAVFQEHELARRLNANKSQITPAKAQGPSLGFISSRGPQFNPVVRYWMINPLRSGAWGITAVFLVFFIIDPIVEIVFYSLIKTHNLRCRWYCHLAFAYPWPIVIWTVITITLLRMKIPFDRRVFTKGPRLDALVTITALPFIPLWLLVHITRFAEFSLDSGDEYTNYIDSDPGRSRAYGAILGLKILELTFALLLALSLSIMGHTIYKFYKSGKSSSELN